MLITLNNNELMQTNGGYIFPVIELGWKAAAALFSAGYAVGCAVTNFVYDCIEAEEMREEAAQLRGN